VSEFAMTRTCAECPWRRDVATGKFPASRFRSLRATCEPGGLPAVFACHMTPEGAERACAGFLAVCGADSNRVRIAVYQGRVELDAIQSDGPLYGSFAEMARANGYDPDTETFEHAPILSSSRD